MLKKTRTEIPGDTATDVLFASDRTCCVCRQRQKPVQLHHIDENPSNNAHDNLAVLCFDCHHETQLRGGFNRKLDAAQVLRYRDDWVKRVAANRDKEHRPPGTAQPHLLGTEVLRFLKAEETSNEHAYLFDAEYPQLSSDDSDYHSEVNLCIVAFVTGFLQRFRANAIRYSVQKKEMKKAEFDVTAFDSLSISHKIWLFNSDLLSIEFAVWNYAAGAAHPNHNTHVLNFRLNPPMRLELTDVFDQSIDYMRLLSEYCINELHRQQQRRFADPKERADWLTKHQDDWILRGAGPSQSNYNTLVIEGDGVRVFFDEYQVGSYAEGRYEVFIPLPVIAPALSDSMKVIMRVRR